jgi:hypothetical protein
LAGKGGGASIGLLVQATAAAFTDCSIVVTDGGEGRRGGDGEAARPGGARGDPTSLNGEVGCFGGFGGTGAGGSGGAGGNGGLSAGIVFAGTPPSWDGRAQTDAATLPRITLGKPGAGGARGLGGARATTNGIAGNAGLDGVDGFAGIARAVHPID